MYNCAKNIIERWDNDIIVQCVALLFVIIGISILNKKESGTLSFKEYSKKIEAFTRRANDSSEVTLIAGDMDFFGRISVDKTNVSPLMSENNEYKQLYSFKDKIKLKVLCSNKLQKDTVDAIVHGTMKPELLYNKYRIGNNLNDPIFQQLLRIGKIKSDFIGAEIRFYNSDTDDKRLRARFIDNEGIVYRKEDTRDKIFVKDAIMALKGNPFKLLERWKKLQKKEDLYSVNYLSAQEFDLYNDMFQTKWNACDLERCKKIVSFCEELYHYVNDEENLYKMALIYVNSYEVARKGERRKEFPPFGVLYLAASVRQERGWKVDVISVDENTKNDKLNWVNYDVIGFSIVSSYSYGILKKCYDASKRKRDVVILAGGYQAEKFCNEVFRDFDADIIFKGEGENSIRKFCQHYKDRNFESVKGIIYKNSQNEPIATKDRAEIDINKIPEPARLLLPTEDVVMKDRLAGTEKKMVHMLFSRGCPYNCYYCAANQDGKNKKIRYRDKRKIVDELNNLKNTYGIEGFSIIDDCFLTDEDKAIEICDFLQQQKLNLVWSLAARVDHINDKVLRALKKAGCIEIKFGVETGSDKLLQEMQKNVDIKKAEEAIRNTKKYGIGVKLFIITGLPGETNDTHEETKKFLERMKAEELVDRVSLLRYTPLAGSHIYDVPDKFGINGRTLKIENFDKMHLYRKSHDWWDDKKRFADCNRWYNDMQNFIDANWTE